MRVGLWGWVCGRVCLGYYMCLSLSGSVCASVCLCVCAIQSRTEEGKSSGSMFYLTLYETLVNWLKRNGIPQVTDIGTVKKLPEDLTLAGSVITNTCKALPCKGERCTCQPTSAWRKERQGFSPEQKRASPSSVLCCHTAAWGICLSACTESYSIVSGLTICTVFPKIRLSLPVYAQEGSGFYNNSPVPLEFPLAVWEATCQSMLI